MLATGDDETPLPGALSSEETAEEALANLANGPTWFVGDTLRDGAPMLGSMQRRDAVELMIEIGGGLVGSSEALRGGSAEH